MFFRDFQDFFRMQGKLGWDVCVVEISIALYSIAVDDDHGDGVARGDGCSELVDHG